MKHIVTAAILRLAALVTGCATADKLNDMRIGMSKDQGALTDEEFQQAKQKLLSAQK
jgi:hypothetical protein